MLQLIRICISFFVIHKSTTRSLSERSLPLNKLLDNRNKSVSLKISLSRLLGPIAKARVARLCYSSSSHVCMLCVFCV